MIIDFHTHIFPPEIKDNREKYLACDPLFRSLYSNSRAKLATADDLIESMDEQDIDTAVVLNIEWSDMNICRRTNDYILESVTRYPGRLIGFCMIKLDSPGSAIDEIARCARSGIRGVGEIRPEPGTLKSVQNIQPVIEKIIEENLVLLTHSTEPVGHIYPGKGDTTPETLYPFIASFSKLKLVCAHWGGGLPFYALMPEVRKAFDNVYFDSAASPYIYNAQVYNHVARIVGPEKILFGSDYPLLSPKRLLNEIESLGLSIETREKILFRNARELLGL